MTSTPSESNSATHEQQPPGVSSPGQSPTGSVSDPAAARTRIAAVSYLNTRPLIVGLDVERSFELISRPPARIIDLLLPTDDATVPVDIALVSLVDVLRSAGALSLVPVGMIASDGPTHTVRLYSRVPLDRVTVLHADTESHTSVALASLILDGLGASATVVDLPVEPGAGRGFEEIEAVLLIGDKVVTAPPPEDAFPYQLDLGAAWRELTGLPFVYAVWACRSADVDHAHPGFHPAAAARVARAAVLLDRQRRHNATRLDWIVQRTSVVHGWPEDAARTYVGELLRYTIDDRARAGVAEFVKRLNERAPGSATEPSWLDVSTLTAAAQTV